MGPLTAPETDALRAATAAQYRSRLVPIMALAIVLGMAFTCGGLVLSCAPDLPAGATIILLAGTTYLVSLGTRRLRSRHKTRRTRA